MTKRFSYSIFIVLGFITYAITRFFKSRPDLCELWYQQFFYSKIRTVYDFLLSWSPIPLVYILILCLIFQLVRTTLKPRQYVFSIFRFIYRFTAICALIYFLFQLLWGFNYQQRDLKNRLDLANVEKDENIYLQRLEALICAMEEARIDLEIPVDNEITELPDKLFIEDEVRKEMRLFLSTNKLYSQGEVRVRILNPPGSLLSLSTAGIYIPFVFEGHIDAGLHPIQIPFTLAHEMAHGYAVTDEGEANFVAFIVCSKSSDPFIRYSGLFSYFRYLASNIYRNDPHSYKLIQSQYPEFIRMDLNAVRKKMEEYPDLLPKLRNWMYDHYLNAQGVHGGIKSYSTIVQMVTAWEIKHAFLY